MNGNETDSIFQKLIGPSYLAPTVPEPETLTPSSNTPIFDRMMKPEATPATSFAQAPVSDTPIFDRMMKSQVSPISDTPIFDQMMKLSTVKPSIPPVVPLMPAIPRPSPPIVEPSTRGWIGDVASGIARGLAVRLPEQVGHVIKYAATNPTGLITFSPSGEPVSGEGFFKQLGDAMTDWAEKAPTRYPFLAPSKAEGESLLRRGVTGTFENAPVSLTPMIGGAILGSLLIPGPGTVVGGLLGAGLATMATFGASSFNQTYEDAIKQGLNKADAARLAGKIGWIEGGIEAVTDPIEMMTGGFGKLGTQPLKQAIRAMLRPSVKELAKNVLFKIGPIETGTEMLQDYLEAKLIQEAGMKGPTPGEAVKEAILPSMGMSILFGIGTHGLNIRMRNRVLNALTDPATSPEDRSQAVLAVRDEINKFFPQDDNELGKLWEMNAFKDIVSGKPIDIDSDFEQYARKAWAIPGAEVIPPVIPPTVTPPAPAVPQGPSVIPPPVTPPPEPTPWPTAAGPVVPPEPTPIPPTAPPGPVFPPQPPVIPPPVVEKPPAAPQPPIAPPGKERVPILPAPTPIPEPLPWAGPDWTEPGREVTFTNPNTDKQMRGVIRDVVLGPPDGKTPVTITVSPKWRLDQTFDLPAAEVTEPTAISRMKEYHAALEGLHPADRAQVRKDAKEFDRLLLANADLFVEKGMIDYFYEGATTPRKQAIASNQILNNARSEAGKELAIDNVFNPIRRAESLGKLRDRIERERPGTTVPIPVTPKPTAPPKAETARGPVAVPSAAPVAAPELEGKPFYQQQSGTWYLVHPTKDENWKPGDGWVRNKLSPGFKTLRELKEWQKAQEKPAPAPAPEVPKEVTPPAKPQKGFAAEIKAEGKWTRNAMVFGSKDEAERSASDILSRWMGAQDSRVIEVDETPNWRWTDKGLEMIEEVKPAPVPEKPVEPTPPTPAPVPTPAPTPELPEGMKLSDLSINDRLRRAIFTDMEVARRLAESMGRKVFVDAIREDRFYWIDPDSPPKSISNPQGNQRTIPKEDIEKTRDQIIEDLKSGAYLLVKDQNENIQIIPNPSMAPAPEVPAPTKPEHRLVVKFATTLKDRIDKGNPITNTELFTMAAVEFGGTRAEGKFTPRQAYDAMEMGVNQHIRENPDKATPEGLKKLESILPTESIRTENVQKFQQFSTPPRIAHATNWLANLNERDVFAETSAGNGGLAVFADVAGVKGMVLNELDKGRVENLKFLFPKAEVFNENAEHASDIIGPKLEEKPTVAVINPPFSASGERMPGKKILDVVEKHIDQALKLLQPNGRLVVITGRGFTIEAPTFKEFWDKIKSQYNVKANIGLAGKNYRKYGTSFDIRITVIDKTGPTIDKIYDRYYDNIEEIFNDQKLGEVRNARPEITRVVEGKPGAREPVIETGFEEGRGVARPGGPVLGPTGELVPGERGAPPVEPGLPAAVGGIPSPVPGEGYGLPGAGVGRGGAGELGGREGELRPGGPGGIIARPPGLAPERGGLGLPTAIGGELPVGPGIKIEATKQEPTPFTDKIFDDMPKEKMTVNGVDVKTHPTDLVESAAQAAVQSPDVADIKLNLKPENLKEVSSAQIKMAMLSVRAHEKGLGFFNGGGTGYGKGLVNAITAMHYVNSGKRKVVWISEKSALLKDATRDWGMAGGDKSFVVPFSKVKGMETISNYLKRKKLPSDQGLLFLTYDTLKQEASQKNAEKGGKNRMDQVLDWLGPNFDGLVIFDESHNMSNATAEKGKFGRKKPAAKALVGLALQDALPTAKVIYSSATGATELSNLAYTKKLNLWGEGTPFANVQDFIGKVGPWGIAGMEMVSSDMKRMGLYMAPSISFEGVSYDKLTHTITPEQGEVYNEVARAWQRVLHNIGAVMEATGANKAPGARNAAYSSFWGAQQRFFQQILLSMQMPAVINSIKEDLAHPEGRSAVVQLVNTNEASQERERARQTEEQELEELDLTPKDILLTYLERSFPIYKYEEYTDENGNVRSRLVVDSQGNNVIDPEAVAVRDRAMAELASLKFPDNPLDILINEFGTDAVAEITGRKSRIIRMAGEKAREEKRSDRIVESEVNDFIEGKRRILVFSEKGGIGRSYHADRTYPNQQKRMHYVLQAGWAAAKAIQGMGRTHRTNQVVPPDYKLVSTNLKGQMRFVSTIARRLDQLGALTKGQRQTTSQGLFTARDNLENEQAREALGRLYTDVYNGSVPGMTVAEFENQTGLRLRDNHGNLREDLPPINQFLNRLLSMEIDKQNIVFEHFSQLQDRAIAQAEKEGRLDIGLQNLHALNVDIVSDKTVHTDEVSGAQTKYTVIDATHQAQIFNYAGMASWADKVVRNVRSEKIWAAGKIFNRTMADGSIERVVPLRSPNYTSEYIKVNELSDVKKWTQVPRENVKAEWEKAVDEAPKTFIKKYHLITGAIMPIWDRLSPNGGVIRFQAKDGKRYIGKIILEKELPKIMENLRAEMDPIVLRPKEIYESVMDQNNIVRMANGWKFRRSRTMGEERLELAGPDKGFNNWLREIGVNIEYIDYRTRYFLPANPYQANEMIEKIIKNRPIVSVDSPSANKVFFSMADAGVLPAMREEGRLTAELTPDWKENLFTKKDYSAETAVQFLAKNSPIIENRTLFQVLLSNNNVVKKLRNLPVAIVDTTETVGKGGRAYYDSGDHRIFIDEDYTNSSKERVSGTFIEEIIHGLTHETMTPNNEMELQAMMNRAIAHLPEKERASARKKLPSYEHTYLKMAGLTSQGRAVYYSLTNIDEFLAGAIRHPEVREFLKSIPEMEGIGKPTSLWDRFTQWMSRVIFGDVENASLLRQVLEKAGELIERPTLTMAGVAAERANRFFAIDDAPLPIPMQDNIDALTDPQLSHLAASDPGFIAWMKQRMGVLNIPDTDLKKMEQYLSLPYYMSKKYPVFRKLVNRQILREEKRSEGAQQFLESSRPFMMLKGDQLQKVERALSEGDREHAVYNEETLQQRFGLSDTGVEAYTAARSTLDIMIQRWVDHAEWALLRPFEKKLTGDEYQQLASIYKQSLSPEEISVLPPKVAKAYIRLRPHVNLIKRIRSRTAELKGYFPRYREPGKYYITVKRTPTEEGAKEETIFTTFANSEWETTKIVNELKANAEPDEKVYYGIHAQEAESSFFGVSDMNLQRLVDNAIATIKQEGSLDQESALELRAALSGAIAETLMSRGAGARMIKRSKTIIEGYKTTDLQQVLKNYIVGYMGMETKQDAAYDFLEGLAEVPKKNPVLFQETSNYVDTMLRNYDKEDKWFSKVRALAFTYYLAGSIRAAAVQFTQNFVTGIPFLAREMKGMGWLGAEKAYSKAMWDISFGNLTDEEKFMEHELLMKGVSNDQYIRSISREIRGTMSETWGRVFDILAMPFSKMEIWNRKSAGLAAFRVYRQKGLSFDEAMEKAKDLIYDTHYLMTKANLPHAARGGDIPSKLIGTAYTFRRFTHNYILSMIYSMRGEDGRFHWKNMDVFVRSLAWMAVFAGLSGLPFLDDLLDELEKFFGKPFRKQISDELRVIGGEPLERAGMAGLPALLGQIPGMVGVDLSGSLRLGLPSLMQPGKGAQETVFGVWGGLAKKMTNAWDSVGREDYLRAVEFASPAFIENVLKASRMTTIGATTPGGKILFDEKGRPIKETTGEATAQMLGFRPERIAAVAQTHRGFVNVETKFAGIRDNLYARFRLANTGEERTKVIRDVQRYNMDAQKYRGAIPLINAESLRKSFVSRPEKRYLLFGAQP